MGKPSVLFVTKRRDDPLAQDALLFATQHFPGCTTVLGKQGEAIPDVVRNWEGDYLVSYLSPWVIPGAVLERAAVAAINFHPGPPEFPGYGCYNFALYEDATTYGVTCHHMAPAVDSGKVIAVSRFPVFPTDDVRSLVKRSSAHLLFLYYRIMSGILNAEPLPSSGESWTRAPFTRSGMLRLFRVSPEMPADEVRRRIRASAYPGFTGAFIEINGQKFYHDPPSRDG